MRRIIFLCLLTSLLLLLGACAMLKPKPAASTLTPRFETIKDISLVGTLNTTTWDKLNFTGYWEEFFPLYYKSSPRENNKFYGTMFVDDPSQMSKDSPVHYMVGVPEGIIANPAEPWHKHTISGGSYAVFTHKGSVDSIGETYNYIYGTWLPTSGVKERQGDQFEYYDERFKDSSPDSIVEIWVPIEK